MTTVASRPKLTIVYIVCPVTIYTGSRRRLDDLHRFTVAAVAMDVGMFAVQLKLRLCIVIKPPYFPAVRRMAAITILPQFPFVTIVLFMTGIALYRGILVRGR